MRFSAHPTLVEFAELLASSGVVPQEIIDRQIAIARDWDGGAETLADALITQGLLTGWQARQIARGRGRSLILESRYRLIDQLVEDATGAVFRAVDMRLDRQVAIKAPRPDRLSSAKALGRFHNEVQANGRLEHPNILRALDAGRDGRIHFIVFEHVDGVPVKTVLAKAGRLVPPLAVHYVQQAAEALEYAYRQGVIHRDIRPANLLVTAEGSVKVFDLGAAPCSVDESGRRDRGGDSNFFPPDDPDADVRPYIAPELAFDTELTDIRSDIYSLGCTLFELLAGRPPFVGDHPWLTRMRGSDSTIPYIPGIDDELHGILERMLAADPGARYQTPADLLKAFRRWQLHVPAQHYRHCATTQPRTWRPPVGAAWLASSSPADADGERSRRSEEWLERHDKGADLPDWLDESEPSGGWSDPDATIYSRQ